MNMCIMKKTTYINNNWRITYYDESFTSTLIKPKTYCLEYDNISINDLSNENIKELIKLLQSSINN